MGFETRFLPDSMHGVFADPQCSRQFAATPMRGPVARFLTVGRQNTGVQRRSQNRGLPTGMISIEPIEPGFEKTLFPADDGRSAGLERQAVQPP